MILTTSSTLFQTYLLQTILINPIAAFFGPHMIFYCIHYTESLLTHLGSKCARTAYGLVQVYLTILWVEVDLRIVSRSGCCSAPCQNINVHCCTYE